MCNHDCDNCKILMDELSDLRYKFKVIDEVDRIKTHLLELDSKRTFSDIIKDKRLKQELEDIFNCPFKYIKAKYFQLLRERNKLVHSRSLHFQFGKNKQINW